VKGERERERQDEGETNEEERQREGKREKGGGTDRIEAPDEDRFAEGSRPDGSILSFADRLDLTSVRSFDDRLGGAIFPSLLLACQSIVEIKRSRDQEIKRSRDQEIKRSRDQERGKTDAGVPDKGRVVGTRPDAVVLRKHCLDGEAVVGKLRDQGKCVDVVKIDRSGSTGGPNAVLVLHHAIHGLSFLL